VRRVYGVRIYKMNEVPSARPGGPMKYRLRWKLPGRDRPFAETFASLPELDSFRSELVTAQNRGEPFDLDTGLPISMLLAEPDDEETPRVSFLAFAREYAGMKWPDVSAKSRETIAQTLSAVAVAMVEDAPQRPNGNTLWRVLSTYAFVPSLWPDDERPERVPRSPSPYGKAELPSDQRKALAWIESASLPLASLADAKTARRALDKLKVTQDGSKAAESYFRRRRGVLVNLIGYAIESGELDANPLAKLNEKAPKKSGPIDKSVVFNPAQAADVLAAISYVGSYRRARGRRLVVLFAMLFYAMLRPEEALFVHDYDCTLPEDPKTWGSIRLTQTRPTAGRRWTDTGRIHDERGLKARSETDVRIVPIPPVLVAIIRAHIAEFGTAPDGRLVKNERGGIPVASTYTRVWREARPLAFTPAQLASGFAEDPYDNRHAGISVMLNAGVDALDVAERAGNSAEVIHRVYGHRTAGRDQINNGKVDAFLKEHGL
jgi:integrase